MKNELDEVSGGMIFYAAGYVGEPSLPGSVVVANNDCHCNGGLQHTG